MALRWKRKNKFVAPAVVYFTQAPNDTGTRQLCVIVECIYAGSRAGPVWSHSSAAVKRALATLTKKCECGRSFHKQRFTEGRRVKTGNDD